MIVNQNPDITEIVKRSNVIEDVLRSSVRDALRIHKALGNPIPIWKDERVVWVPAEKITIDGELEA